MIKISTTDALIGIKTTPTRVSISQPKADFELNIEDPKLEIRTEQIQIQIDQQQCFNESGLKDFSTLIRDNAMEAKQAVFEGIARRMSEGNMMAAIENGGNAISQIAFNNSFTEHIFNIVTMPKSRPEIDFIGGSVDITVHEGYVNLQSKPNMPVIDVQVGDVDIFLRQSPDINFEYVGNEIDEIV